MTFSIFCFVRERVKKKAKDIKFTVIYNRGKSKISRLGNCNQLLSITWPICTVALRVRTQRHFRTQQHFGKT